MVCVLYVLSLFPLCLLYFMVGLWYVCGIYGMFVLRLLYVYLCCGMFIACLFLFMICLFMMRNVKCMFIVVYGMFIYEGVCLLHVYCCLLYVYLCCGMFIVCLLLLMVCVVYMCGMFMVCLWYVYGKVCCVTEAITDAAHSLTGIFHTPEQIHLSLETHVSVNHVTGCIQLTQKLV